MDLKSFFRSAKSRPTSVPQPWPGARLSVEALDDRIVPTAMLTIDDATIWEGNSGVQNALVTVRLTEPHGNSVTVKYSTVDVTAHAGVDYYAISGRLTFAKNEMSRSILVPVPGDRLPEDGGEFAVHLSNAAGAKIARNEGYVTVMDDEPRVSIHDVSRSEGNSGAAPLTFRLTLSNTYDLPVAVHYATADMSAAAGLDYAATTGSLTFLPGENEQTVAVMVNGDRLGEGYETFAVCVDPADSYALAFKSTGIGTIIDDEPVIIISDAYNAGQATFTFTVNLSAAYDGLVTVNFATVDGTALAGVDYVSASGTLTFAAGETTKTITVVALDPTDMPDKYFYVHLGGASTNAFIGNEQAFGFYDFYYSGGGGWDYGPYGGGW